MKSLTSSRPRRGAWSEYWSKISGAASSSMISGFQGLPQNPSNQRPTMALLSCSRDILEPLGAVNEGVTTFWRGLSTSRVGGVDIRSLLFDSWSSHSGSTRDATRHRSAPQWHAEGQEAAP